ncbi:DUF4198 domain-containing protein [Rodentibacter pneumotropicus]|uniref:DUF4198 domain-containing protein n=1 Tax=Rodentibacter pneumotropicus TaxID=758 RepID=UPI0003752E69|nr:DUF4198 domain-containing protein [Rodentibacter pneumotropicus]NBH75044.1 DUF4198 domain-containing protein [Rodentibacter pneumotropicus]OOF61696.1 hypothetical protein BH925_01855 [Rodentibacter pneumotropicus]THA04541.1 DUF4198 domain-containing protein [Rodentibacter pneumotropicus]THA05579.1 DUF4198 domain-containing protein [Rodentibacter pneumotropicus]THA14308.1 DUF4198 domain-containing protein [Rodentibacter pneumotropicus]
MQLKKLTVGLVALFGLSMANAHNVWLEPTSSQGEYVMKFGHTETGSYPQHKIQSFQVLNSQGKLTALDYKFKDGEAYIVPKSDIVFITFNNGVWSKLPSGKYVEKTKREEPSAEFSTNPLKLGKAILKWDEQSFKAHDVAYELIPQARAEAGKSLAILVLHNGKPVQGIKVGVGEDAPFNLTNEKGIAEFTPVKGYNKVWAEFEENVQGNPDYDRRSIEYMLTFDGQ